MQYREIDCRGLACPQPVLETKKALERLERGVLRVLVDSEAARDNVRRFALNAGCTVDVTAEGGGTYRLTIVRGSEAAPGAGHEAVPPASCLPKQPEARPVYFVTANTMGQGAADLGETLMKSFFGTLAARQPAPAAVIFLNTGVYLTTARSPVLEALRQLAAAGTDVLSCGTCLEYYGLKDEVAVGRVSNMYEICAFLAGPYKVVTIG